MIIPDKANAKRASGYYWVQSKRTGSWMIGKWFKGYSWWDFTYTIPNDLRGGFNVCEKQIMPPKQINEPIKRHRKNANKVHRQRGKKA